MNKDYYSILGITDEEKKLRGKDFEKIVSKKFRSLSIKYHPDKWVNASEKEKKEAEEKFKEISEANSVLSDEAQRNEYDAKMSGGFGADIDMEEFLRRANQAAGFGFQGWGRGPSTPRQERGENITTNIQITLEEAYNGVKKTIKIAKSIKCDKCNGTGSSDGKTHDCPHCNGLGYTEQVHRMGNFMSTMRTSCGYCGGTGKSSADSPCSNCGGTGKIRKYVDVTIDLPRGVQTGMNVKFSGLGGESPNGGENGDLIVNITVLPHDKFVVAGNNNLIYYDKVPFNQALLGYEGSIKCIDGTTLKYKIPELSPDNKSIIFNGKGMPVIDGWGKLIGYGDLAVVVKHEYPSSLTLKQRKALKNF